MNRRISRKNACRDLDIGVAGGKNPYHIRPLGVRPLTYPERVPKAWGFPFFGVRS